MSAFSFLTAASTAKNLGAVHQGLGFLPAILGVVGSIVSLGASVATPFVQNASGGDARVLAAQQQALEAQRAAAAAAQRSKTIRTVAVVGAGVAVVGAVWAYRRSSRRKKQRRSR